MICFNEPLRNFIIPFPSFLFCVYGKDILLLKDHFAEQVPDNERRLPAQAFLVFLVMKFSLKQTEKHKNFFFFLIVNRGIV